MKKLKDQAVLVTGGGSGIGRAIAVLFAEHGADVALCGRTASSIEKTADEIRGLGQRAVVICADISKEEDVRRIVGDMVAELGQVDVVVNNASVVGQVAPVQEQDLVQWNQCMAINLTGAMLVSREVLGYMMPRKKGSIVNVSSNVSRRSVINRAPYVCSKWALNGLTQTLALEAGVHGIRANAICPGPVMNDRLQGSMTRMAAESDISFEALQTEWESESPMKRFATEEECAKAALFFACDDSAGITGQAMNVTAGAVMT